MSFQLTHPRSAVFKPAVFAVGLSLIATQAFAERSGGLFSGLAGYWSGGGVLTKSNGATERIRCKATYAVNPTGNALNQSLRCASDTYRLDIRSNVISQGGAISGSWSEASHNVSGSISGRANGAEIVANVAGAGFTASLDVHTRGTRQSVTIRPQGGTDVAAVSVSLRKD